jgi:hypothetical protein
MRDVATWRLDQPPTNVCSIDELLLVVMVSGGVPGRVMADDV